MVLTALLAAALATRGPADPGAAAFARHPARITHVPHRTRLRATDPLSRRYRSALLEAAAKRPDFAGHYVLVSVGCGASCIQVAALDRASGTVAWLPHTLCCWPLEVSEPLRYTVRSRLVEMQGQLDEQEPTATRRYLFDGRRFVLVG